MCLSISITTSVLLPTIQVLSKSSNFIKREIFTRTLTITAIFFRTIDVLLNTGLVSARSIGYLLRDLGFKFIPADLVSPMRIYSNIKAADKAIFGQHDLFFKTFLNPKHSQTFKICSGSSFEQVTLSTQRIFHQTLAKRDLNNLPAHELDRNWNLNEYFGHIYVINLDDRPDATDSTKHKKRFDGIVEDLNKIGCTTFERLRATYGAHELTRDVWNRMNDNSWNKQGAELDRQHANQAGCFMSHYRAIKDANEKYIQAQEDLKVAQNLLLTAQTTLERELAQTSIDRAEKKVKEYSNILILEDDNGFGFLKGPKNALTITKEGTGVEFRKVMKELPDDWDMFYFVHVDGERFRWFGGILSNLRDYAHPHLNRLGYGLLANAVAINSRAYPKILRELSKIDQPNQSYRPVDHEYALLHDCELAAYGSKRPLAFQGAGASSITDGEGGPWDGTSIRGY